MDSLQSGVHRLVRVLNRVAPRLDAQELEEIRLAIEEIREVLARIFPLTDRNTV